MSRVSAIIPCRENAPPVTTLRSLNVQTYTDFSVRWVYDEGHGKSWAVNRGVERYAEGSEFLLMSDDDIQWSPSALSRLVESLDANKEAAYAYGYFMFTGDDVVHGGIPFDSERLKLYNYISWNSLVRTAAWPGCDESLKRLIDYDAWLTMLLRGQVGMSCGRLIFTTDVKAGITHENTEMSCEQAMEIVHKKHGLWKEPQCQGLPEKTCSASATGTDTTESA